MVTPTADAPRAQWLANDACGASTAHQWSPRPLTATEPKNKEGGGGTESTHVVHRERWAASVLRSTVEAGQRCQLRGAFCQLREATVEDCAVPGPSCWRSRCRGR
jgi:hypothetical protein